MTRAAVGAVAGNLLLFIGLCSWPAFQEIHHHWVFPILALAFGAQWGFPPLRSSALSLLAFLLAMGIVRHDTILSCADRCAFKLAAAALLAAPVFWVHARRDEEGWWNAPRCRTAAGLSAGAAAILAVGAGPLGAAAAASGKPAELSAIAAGLVLSAAALAWAGRR